jgi:thiol-disulfide isomerase/thioredoxin
MKMGSASAKVMLALVGALASTMCLASVTVGDVPPDHLGHDFNDQPVSAADHKGRVLVVTFWATWCPPCRLEMSVLEKLQRAAGAEALRVVAVNFKEDSQTWRTIKRQLAPFAIEVTRDKDLNVQKSYGVKGIPHMFMINKAGRIAHIHVGYGEKQLDTLVRQINELLAEQEPEAPADGALRPLL